MWGRVVERMENGHIERLAVDLMPMKLMRFTAPGLARVPYHQVTALDAVTSLTTGAGWASLRRGAQQNLSSEP